MVQSEPEICDFCQFTARSRLHTATENSSESVYDDEAAGEVKSVRPTRDGIFFDELRAAGSNVNADMANHSEEALSLHSG